MTAPSAWQIEQAMSVLQSLAHHLREADAIPDDDDALLTALDATAPDCMDVLRRVIVASLDADALVDAADARVKALAERRDRFKRRRDALRGAAMAAMDALGLPKLADAEFTASLRAGQPVPIVTDESALPPEYWRVTRSVSMSAIRDALKVGEIPPGVEIGNGAPILTIRSK